MRVRMRIENIGAVLIQTKFGLLIIGTPRISGEPAMAATIAQRKIDRGRIRFAETPTTNSEISYFAK